MCEHFFFEHFRRTGGPGQAIRGSPLCVVMMQLRGVYFARRNVWFLEIPGRSDAETVDHPLIFYISLEYVFQVYV